MNFRQRLGLFLIITLVVVQVLTALSAYFYLRRDLLARAQREMATTMGVFTRQMDFLSERVADGVEVMSLDYGLRSAIANHDTATQLSAFRNHGHRIGATRMLIVGLDGNITADTGLTLTGRPFPYRQLLSHADVQDKTTGLISFAGRLFWAVVVPVRAPVPIGYIAAYVPIDDALLKEVRTISATRPSIALMTVAPGGHWTIAAESDMHRKTVELPAQGGIAATSSVVEDGDLEYLVSSTPLPVAQGSAPVAAMLEYPLDEALAAYRGLVAPMLAVLLLGLLAMLAGGAVIVRGVSRPLELLAATARRIAGGDYTPPPALKRSDEIGALSEALATMTASVAEREQKLKDAVILTERAKDEAVCANQAKSQFLSNMSHELRTPLNAILGFSEMIKSQVLGPIGVPRYGAYAEDIHGAGRHLLMLVERVLSIAEAEENRLVLQKDWLNPGDLLREAVVAMKDFAERSRVGLRVDIPAALPGLSGDAEKLKLAFTNIIHNAIRFSHNGTNVDIGASVAGEHMTIFVRDSGIGMDAEAVTHVTRPFHRLRPAFDGTHQGAGLGLPFAKVIIDLHGGLLAISSAPRLGTEICITLPIAAARSEAA